MMVYIKKYTPSSSSTFATDMLSKKFAQNRSNYSKSMKRRSEQIKPVIATVAVTKLMSKHLSIM